jgi:hypothetical protein
MDECRSSMGSQLVAYKDLVSAAGAGKSVFKKAADSFALLFFNNLVLVVDSFFLHRSRMLEGKDGNR